MMIRVNVALEERAFVHVDRAPVRYLRPGRHWVFARPFRRVDIVRVPTETLVSRLAAEQLALVPVEDLSAIHFGEGDCVVVVVLGPPVRWLATPEAPTPELPCEHACSDRARRGDVRGGPSFAWRERATTNRG